MEACGCKASDVEILCKLMGKDWELHMPEQRKGIVSLALVFFCAVAIVG